MKEEIWKFYKDTRTNNIRNTRGAKWEVSNYGRVKRNGILYNPCGKDYYTIGAHTALHRVVAELFIPNPENKPCVDHIDTNPKNNKVDNLRWVTQKENCNNPISKQKHSDNHACMKGEKNPMYGKNPENYMSQQAIKDKHQKQSNSLKIYYLNHVSPMKNKHHSEETKQKMHEARLNYLKNK